MSHSAFLQHERPGVFHAAGKAEPARRYESPFTDLGPRRPDELFSTAQVDSLVAPLEAVRSTAVAT